MAIAPVTEDVVVERFAPKRGSLRLALVTETWPPEINGVAMSMERVVTGLQRRGHDVQLVRPRQRSDEGRAETPGLEQLLTHGLPIPNYPSLRLGVPQKRTLVRIWSERRPDVVHLATEGPLGWSALQAATHLRLPVTSDFRTNFHAYSRHYGLGWLQRPIGAYLRKFHNRADLTTVPTESLRRELSASGFRKLAVVPRGVDVERFQPRRRSATLRHTWGVAQCDALVVTCVGRLAPEKNLETLFAAFDAIRAKVPDARLVLVGDGPMRGSLQAARPDVVFAGQRAGLDLAEHYASADLFLFPSRTETFGNVTTEAMASGLPVVAFDYAGAAQLVRDGHSGRLVPFGDDAAFVRAAAALSEDPLLRARMGARAREAVARLGWDEVVERFETLLHETARARA